MKNTPAWRRYLRFWRANIADDVDAELRFHTDMRVREYMARGLTEDDARRAVAQRLGDVDAAKAECIALGEVRETHARNADFLDGLRADVRFALRSLGRAPGWTAVALLTIALGVGATTTVFSIADTLLVRPLPYPKASRIFMARRDFQADGQKVPVWLPMGILREWREHASTIEAAAAFRSAGPRRLGRGADTASVSVANIDLDFLAFAGVRPLVGRNFTSQEVTREGPSAMLLTEQFWRRQYGGSRDVIGTVAQLDDRPYTIVGVVPASFSIPDFRTEHADVLTPALLAGGGHMLVRLRPGISPQAAAEELNAILKHAPVDDVKPMPGEMPVHLSRPQDWLAIRQPLVMLTGAVALLLVVACTNVAHLLLARGAGRQRELAVRHALGAGRSRLLRQLVTESVVLAAMGGVIAVAVGWGGLRLIAAVRPPDLVALSYVSTNRGVLTTASVLAILCGLAIGLLAALRIAGRDIAVSLRAGAASTSSSGSRRLRATLVVGEVALSATLLVGALLLIHAVFDLQRTNLGFDARGLYSVTIPVRPGASAAERSALGLLARERAAAIPGVDGVVLATGAPGPRGIRMLAAYETPERAVTVDFNSSSAKDVASWSTSLNYVAPEYFAMMRMPLLAGRTFDEGSAARNEVIISATLARQVWPEGSALGRRLRNVVPKTRGVTEPWQTVIGIAPDVVSNLVEGATPALYHPLAAVDTNMPLQRVVLLARLQRPDVVTRLRQLTNSVPADRSGPVVQNVRETIEDTLAQPRFTMRILATFAVLGITLAAIGLFGVISYSVGQRTREIGVRMTLGATRSSIARLVVGDGIRLALVGIGVGLLGAVAATRLIQSLLYGVSRFDPFSFGVGAVLLLAVSIVACVIPMLRATGVDPAIAVRND
jgi:putative ABC transport system permease protein